MSDRPFTEISFEKYKNEDKLMASKCTNCGALFVPPRAICDECHGNDMEWAEMGGRGKLKTYTCVAVGPPFMIEEGYDRNNPYCCAVVELDEGTTVLARIDGIDAGKPEGIKVGMPVKAVLIHRGEGEEKNTVLTFVSA